MGMKVRNNYAFIYFHISGNDLARFYMYVCFKILGLIMAISTIVLLYMSMATA